MKNVLNAVGAKLKSMLAFILLLIKRIILGILVGIKKLVFGVLSNRLVIALACSSISFVLGSRLLETGHIGHEKKGTTVFISGPCAMFHSKMPKRPDLAEDEVKVTGEDADSLIGVIRSTREVVECKKSLVAVDHKLLISLFRPDVTIPAMSAAPNEIKEPEWKSLNKKMLVMSGTCVGADGKTLPAFTDEKIDVTNVESAKDDPQLFIISGIKRSDKIAIACTSSMVKYSADNEAVAHVATEEAKPLPLNYVGQKLLITGLCYPDLEVRKKTHASRSKIAFYKLSDDLVSITKQALDSSGNIKQVMGVAIQYHSDPIICDQTDSPFTFRVYDSESTRLEPVDHGQDKTATVPEQSAVPVDNAVQNNQNSPVNN